ncbi:hypothetical protein [Streptomyces sp. NPDC086182]|jgi:hypothetical protein|uniref:hypothetical protein n=1 Tax=Streptomyces sp. NPDC086182 TaxID=3155058 RepID=UPI003427C489
MARLQILELPEGASDDRPPFVLVIDEATEETAESLNEVGISTAELIGARTVLVFSETVEIPANDTTAYLAVGEAEERAEPQRLDERAIQAEEKLKAFMDKRYAVEQDRKAALLDAVGMDRTRDWDDICNAAVGLRKERDAQAEALERVRRSSIKPEFMNAQQEHPAVWRHGYECGVLAAKAATRQRDESTVKS